MNKKRFKYEYGLIWNENGEKFDVNECEGRRLVCDKLNEQQATITKLEQICETKMQEIEDIKYSLKEIAYKYRKEVQFKADTDPNQAVKEVLDEQQATIHKLQDLCGESDGENAKLRIENKKLKAKLKEKEEDERLYANEILELRETNKEHIKFKSLGGNY